MSKENVTPIRTEESTKCFTYKVTMIVQVLHDDEAKAKSQLDTQGGYITKRDVELIKTVELYNGKEK